MISLSLLTNAEPINTGSLFLPFLNAGEIAGTQTIDPPFRTERLHRQKRYLRRREASEQDVSNRVGLPLKSGIKSMRVFCFCRKPG